MKEGWKDEELRNWTSAICGKMLLTVLWGFIFRTFMLYYFSDMPWQKVMHFNLLYIVALLEHQLTAWTKSPRLKIIGCYVYVELMQVFLYIMTIYADPAHNVFYAMTSTLFCLNYQITLNTSTIMVAFYVLKQFISWTMISITVGQYEFQTFFPYMPMIMMIFLTVSVTNYRQKLAKERSEFSSSLLDQERRLHSIMQAIPDGLLVVTETKEVKTWNEELSRLLHSESREGEIQAAMQELMYEPGTKKYASSNLDLWADIFHFIASDEEPQTFGLTLVNGRYLEWKASRGRWDQAKACILTVRDFSDWVKLQEKLQKESASKTALLRSVSHELRTPTNAIINLVREVREMEVLTPRGTEDLQLVHICTHFLLSMINDLLDFSKLIAGQFTLVKTHFNLSQELRHSILLFEPQCRVKMLDFSLNIDPLLPVQAFSDPNRMRQVLLNLLSNSVKFTKSGFIQVLALAASPYRMKISVTDSGIGIAKHKQGNLFKLFGQIAGNELLNPQGCGLGLSIANALALELGGEEIELDSDEGKGATFSFYVFLTSELRKDEEACFPSEGPMYEIPVEVSHCLLMPNLLTTEHSFDRVKRLPFILVVDDAEFNRLVMRKLLGGLGLDCAEACNGLQAISVIKGVYQERGHCFRVLLMDLEMPEMGGIVATREILGMVARSEIPVKPNIIACSAYSSNEDKALCSQAGMSAYLEKPVSKERLEEVLTEFL